MGTRLRPNTKDPAVLERLAGVPAGTTSQLQAMDHDTAVTCDGSVGALVTFDLEGLGRLSEASLRLVQKWGLDYSAGETGDPTRVSLTARSRALYPKGQCREE